MKADISGMPFISIPSTFVYDDKWNTLSSTSQAEFTFLTPSQPVSLDSDHPFSHGFLAPESFMLHSGPSTTHYCPRFPQGGNM